MLCFPPRVLRQQGEAKIEGFFQAVLEKLPQPPALANQARCAALLGAMMPVRRPARSADLGTSG